MDWGCSRVESSRPATTEGGETVFGEISKKESSYPGVSAFSYICHYRAKCVRKKQGIVLVIEQEIDVFFNKGEKFKSSIPVEIREIAVPLYASPSSEKTRKHKVIYIDIKIVHSKSPFRSSQVWEKSAIVGTDGKKRSIACAHQFFKSFISSHLRT